MVNKINKFKLFCGENSYESWKAVEKERSEFMKNYPNGEVVEYSDENTNLSFSALGFFNLPRLWIIKRFFQFPKNIQESIWEEISKYGDLNIVFWEDKNADKRLSIYKKLVENHEVKEYKFLKETDMRKWIENLLKRKKITSNFDLVSELVFRFVNDQYRIESEVEKIEMYLLSNNKAIFEQEDVKVLSMSQNFDMWSFVESFYGKNKSKAISQLDLLEDDVNQGGMIIGGLFSNLRPIFIVLKYGQKAELVSKELKIHPFVFMKAKKYAQYFTLERVERLYDQLLNLDYAFKRSEIDPKLGLGLLIASL